MLLCGCGSIDMKRASPKQQGGKNPTFGTMDFDDAAKPDDVVQGTPLYGTPGPIPHGGGAGAERFTVAGWQDLWAAVLFVAHLAAIATLAYLNRGFVAPAPSPGRRDPLQLSGLSIARLGFESFAGSAATCAGLLAALYRWPEPIIFVSGVATGCITAALGLTLLLGGSVLAGLLLLAFGILAIVMTFVMRHRIPQAAALLTAAIDAITRYWGALVVGFGGLVASAAYFAVWRVAAAPAFAAVVEAGHQARARRRGVPVDGDASVGADLGVVLFYAFCFFWTAQVVANTVQVAAAGTVASWYYIDARHMPPSPARAALRRALTTSLGSVCFGSLVVAVITTLRYALRLMRNVAGEREDFGTCIIDCLLGCLEGLVEYVNVYAFTHVAIYGTGYVDSAHSALRFLQETGWDAIINDNLVWPVLAVANVAGAVVVGAAVGCLHWSATWGLLAFVLAYVAHVVVLNTLYAGIVTLFVCYAECPEAAEQTQPAFAAQMGDVAFMRGLHTARV